MDLIGRDDNDRSIFFDEPCRIFGSPAHVGLVLQRELGNASVPRPGHMANWREQESIYELSMLLTTRFD